MANETQKPIGYDPMKNKPDRKDPEIARLYDHYESEYVTVGDRLQKKFELCPVCGFAMSMQGDDPRRQRLACSWEPLHTPAK